MKKRLLAVAMVACVLLGVTLGAAQNIYAEEACDPICIEPDYTLPPPKVKTR